MHGVWHGWARAFSGLLAARAVACVATVFGIALMSRTLGPARFADLVLCLTVMKVGAEVFGPALDTALVRFGARGSFRPDEHGEGRGETLGHAQVILYAKGVLAAALIGFGFTLMRPLAQLWLGEDGAARLPVGGLPLAMFGAALTLAWSYAQAFFQAQQNFRRYARFEVLSALVRLMFIVGIVVWAQRLSSVGPEMVRLFLAAYIAAAALAAAATWRLLPRDVFRWPSGAASQVRDVAGFTKWAFLACCFTSLAHRADIFLVNRFPHLGRDAVGQYSGAVQLVLLGDLVILTLFNVLLPKASGLRTPDQMRRFLRGFRMPALWAGLAAVPIILGAGPLARVVLGPAYGATG